MIGEECPPGLRRWPLGTDQILAHAGPADFDTELEQFTVDPRRTPEIRLMLRIRSRTSFGIAGRPGCPCRTFQVQNTRKPLRCQAITVPGLTITNADCQSLQSRHSQAQKNRSAAVSFGRFFAERWS